MLNRGALAILAMSAALSTAYGQTTTNAATPIAATAATVIPSLIRFQGTDLQNAAGAEKTVTFLIFKEEKGGEALWKETQAISFDSRGKYEVELGATYSSGLPFDLFNTGEARWLEVQIAGQTTEPRVLLASVPYALKAADAATLGGLPASAFVLAGSTSGAGSNPAAITPNAVSTVTTTGGTANKVARFSGTNTVVSSSLYDNGTEVGIGTTVPTSTLTVNGTSAFSGAMNINPAGTATASAGADSQQFKMFASAYNSSSKAAVMPHFIWQVEPTGNDTSTTGGTLNLLASPNSGGSSETGFYLNSNGTIHFAPSQTFPAGTGGGGTGTITGVTAGTGLTGGGTSGNVTLNVNTSTIPSLSGNNTLSGTNTFSGRVQFTGTNEFGPSINENTDVNIDVTNSNPGNISPGLRLGNASGEGMSSKRTSGGNQYGVDLYTGYAARLSVTAKGFVGIGTTAPTAQLEVVTNSANVGDAISAFGTSSSGVATSGIYAVGGNSNGGANLAGGNGAFFVGGNADTSEDAGPGFYAVGGTGSSDGNRGYSAVFQDDIEINGNTISDVARTQIDHPSDPANKYLVHASVQSSELMNMYTGNVTTDTAGNAAIALPSWFEAENADFRYQLTVVGQFAQAVVKDEIANGQFTIMTNLPNVKVSWQITAVRQDAFAKAHPLAVEVAKPVREIGFYKHPELYGQPATKQREWARNPRMMQRLQAQRLSAKASSARVEQAATSTPQQTTLQSTPSLLADR